MKKICLIFLLFGSIVCVFSQKDFKPGYIITNDGDTVFGLIEYRGDLYNAGCCMFKNNSLAETHKYNPGEIKSYRIAGGKYYVSRKVTVENENIEVFLEFLVDGQVDFYHLPKSNYFIETSGKELMVLENSKKIAVKNNTDYFIEGKEYIGTISSYTDSTLMYKKILKAKLDHKSLIKIATDYQKLVKPNSGCIVYSKILPKTIVRVGLTGGSNINLIEINQSFSDKIFKSKTTGILSGFQVDISDTANKKVFLSIGAYYSQMKHEILMGKATYSTYNELEFLSKNILLSMTANYVYPKYKIKPFIGIGVMYFHTLKSSENLSEGIDYEPKKTAVGPLLDVGLIYDITRKIALKFESNYEYGLYNDFDDYYISATTDNLNFLISVQYKLGME